MELAAFLILLLLSLSFQLAVERLIRSKKSDMFKTVLAVVGSILFISLILTTMFTLSAKADDIAIRYSVNAIGSPSDVKYVSIGHTFDHYFLEGKLEAGLLLDQRVKKSSTGVGIASLGVAPKAGNFFMSFHQGIALLSNPDDIYLSGNLQFTEDLGVGFRGSNGTAIVLGYRHMSNAGIVNPNLGKDMFYLETRLPQ